MWLLSEFINQDTLEDTAFEYCRHSTIMQITLQRFGNCTILKIAIFLFFEQVVCDQKLQSWRNQNVLVLGNTPSQRYAMSHASADDKFYIFGGNGQTGEYVLQILH